MLRETYSLTTEHIEVVIKESSISRTPYELVDLNSFKIRVYQPRMDYFMVHIRNWYLDYIGSITSAITLVPTLDSVQRVFRAFFRCYSTMQLYPLYFKLGISVPSPSSVKKIFGKVHAPRWLIDICREITRPMTTGTTIFIPLDREEIPICSNSTKTCPLSLADYCTVMKGLTTVDSSLKFDGRQVVEEGILSAPLCVSDGGYSFVDPTVCTWRRKAWYGLQHFVNGDSFQLSFTANQPETFTATRVMLEMFNDLSMSSVVSAREPNAQPEITLNMVYTVMNNDPVVINDVQHCWLFLTDNRTITYDKWITNAMQTSASLLPVLEVKLASVILYGYQERFPTEEIHSRTPPQSPLRESEQLDPKPRKRKKRPRQPVHKGE